jgi:plasmid replication initiation protein
VLTINPNYFRLRKPLERRLYELARKHCGRQASWRISLEGLRDKASSRSVLKEFRRMVRVIVGDDTLPHYRMSLDETDMVEFTLRSRLDFFAKNESRKPISSAEVVS